MLNNMIGYAIGYFTLWFFMTLMTWAIDRMTCDHAHRDSWRKLCGIGLMLTLFSVAGTCATNHIGYPFWLFVVTHLS